MTNKLNAIWKQAEPGRLAEILTTIESPELMRAFLRDIMTEREIIEISARLEAARMLSSGAKYTEIVSKTRLSSRTVARISDWLQNGCGGYRTVLNSLSTHTHILPARAD